MQGWDEIWRCWNGFKSSAKSKYCSDQVMEDVLRNERNRLIRGVVDGVDTVSALFMNLPGSQARKKTSPRAAENIYKGSQASKTRSITKVQSVVSRGRRAESGLSQDGGQPSVWQEVPRTSEGLWWVSVTWWTCVVSGITARAVKLVPDQASTSKGGGHPSRTGWPGICEEKTVDGTAQPQNFIYRDILNPKRNV